MILTIMHQIVSETPHWTVKSATIQNVSVSVQYMDVHHQIIIILLFRVKFDGKHLTNDEVKAVRYIITTSNSIVHVYVSDVCGGWLLLVERLRER